MIKFFRKIRQQLLSQNRFQRYMLYAIGEIALVMIGILLALQVNNWNQSQKDKEFETTMLQEIKGSLESDLRMYDFLKNRVYIKQEGIQKLLKMSASNQVYPDSILLKEYNNMNIPLGFNYNKGGYEAVKSVGIDKISSGSLRKTLIDTYEVQLPSAEQIIGFIFDDVPNNSFKLQLHNRLWKRIRIQLPDSTYKLVSKPLNSENFLKQVELLDRIKAEQDNINVFNFWLNNFHRIVTKCLDAVNQELKDD